MFRHDVFVVFGDGNFNRHGCEVDVKHANNIIEAFKWDHTCYELNKQYGQSFYTRELILEIHQLRAEIARLHRTSSHEGQISVSIYGIVTQLPMIEGIQTNPVLQVGQGKG